MAIGSDWVRQNPYLNPKFLSIPETRKLIPEPDPNGFRIEFGYTRNPNLFRLDLDLDIEYIDPKPDPKSKTQSKPGTRKKP